MTKKLSIITPVYNGAGFVESCILNVIAQQCTDAEHIILDAGSTDGTVDIVKHYAEKYSHIRWVSEKDNGQSDAMNKGIAMARGCILGFLNVDDYYEPNVLNRIVGIFPTLPEPALLVGNCNVLDGHGKLLFLNRPARLRLQDILVAPSINPWPINPSAYFYHKSLHDKIGMYDANENFAFDLEFLLRAVQTAHVTYVNEVWGNFRLIEGTKTFCDKVAGSNVRRIERLLDYYKKDLPLPVQRLFLLYKAAAVFRHWLGYFRDPKLFVDVLKAKIERILGLS